MALNTLCAGDLALVDGLESVTLAGYRPDQGDDYTITMQALIRPIRTAEVEQSNGKYTADDVVIHIEGFIPYVGWTVQSAYGTYTILAVSVETGTVRTRCTARLLFITGLPQVTVNIEQATFAKDATGTPKATWLPFATDIAAHLQTDSGTTDTAGQRTSDRRTATLYVESGLVTLLDGRYRVTVNNVDYYRVLSWGRYQQLDRYLEIQLEHVARWPRET